MGKHYDMTEDQFEQALHLVMRRACKEPDRMNASLNLVLLWAKMQEMGEAAFGYSIQTGHLNPYGGVHGGIVAALMDTCMGTTIAARTNHFVTTTDLSVSYLRALTDSHFRIHISCTHLGKRMASASGQIINADTDELCATAMGTFVLIDNGKAGIRV